MTSHELIVNGISKVTCATIDKPLDVMCWSSDGPAFLSVKWMPWACFCSTSCTVSQRICFYGRHSLDIQWNAYTGVLNMKSTTVGT